MPPPALEALDLNLLVTLHALLAEQSVSRAALRLSLTQSAVSRALGRLRHALDDELFVRAGSSMRPTRRALELAGPLRRILSELEGLLAARCEFSPATAQRRFQVTAVDHAELLLLAPLAVRLEREAPGVDLAVRPLTRDTDRDLETGDLDVAIEPRTPTGAAIVWTPLYDDSYTCVVWAEHAARKLTLPVFAGLGHVLASPWGRPGGVVDDVLAARGLARRVSVQVPNFSLVPHVLVGTRRIATIPSRMAIRLCRLYPLRIIEPPIAIPSFRRCMAWHEVHRGDPGHEWLRSTILRSADDAQAARAAGPRRGQTTRRPTRPTK